MLPILVLVGRPNVGKSTLFNVFTKSRDALVADLPGLTRDRKYGHGQHDGQQFIVVDTGGLVDEDINTPSINALMTEQAFLAINEADAVVYMVDAQSGLTAGDSELAVRLRQSGKPLFLAVNKVDGLDPDMAVSEFYQFGIDDLYPISASHRRGTQQLLEAILEKTAAADGGELESSELEAQDDDEYHTKVAIIGRPNVGKSTLVNRLLGEERVLAYDLPGTTRDSISIPFEKNGNKYTLIDTAGIRKRYKVQDKVEKFSVLKALQAIEASNVVIMILDAQEGVTDQDLHLIGFVIDAGRGLIIAVNKWDGLSAYQRDRVKDALDRKLAFVRFAPIHFISALHGSGVGKLLERVDKIQQNSLQEFSSSELSGLLEQIVASHPPHLVNGRRIKLRYAHQGGRNPPIIVIHGNQTDKLSADYKRYLVNKFREYYSLEGTPLRLVFKSGENPYKNQSNTLSRRQIAKKQRLRKFVNRR